MTLEQAEKLAKERLSPERFLHVQNVAGAARGLALRFGADPEKAELAAWLHDIVKEVSREELLQLLAQDDIMAGSTRERPLPIWHGPCGAIYAKYELGVRDSGVLDAISCHTTGKEDMRLLDKILFLADKISAERSFPGVERVRALAQTDLDAAVREMLAQTVAHLSQTGKPLDEDTLRALDALNPEKQTGC